MEIRQIDNRAVGNPKMKYQYFEMCQLAEYPDITIKIDNDYDEAQIYFDGEQIDTFDIKEIIMEIVEKNIVTVEKAEKEKRKWAIKRIKQNKCPRCYQQLTQDKGTHYCKLCDMHYDSNGTEIKTIKVEMK